MIDAGCQNDVVHAVTIHGWTGFVRYTLSVYGHFLSHVIRKITIAKKKTQKKHHYITNRIRTHCLSGPCVLSYYGHELFQVIIKYTACIITLHNGME